VRRRRFLLQQQLLAALLGPGALWESLPKEDGQDAGVAEG
jgi:hypothetical protein